MAITELLFASLMPDTQREIAETVFERNQRREAEINDALKQEYARREAAIKNMYRLRALRVRRDEKAKTSHPNRWQDGTTRRTQARNFLACHPFVEEGARVRNRFTVPPLPRLQTNPDIGASRYPLSIRRPDFSAGRAHEDEQFGTHSKPWDRSDVLHGVAARETHEGGCAVGHRR